MSERQSFESRREISPELEQDWQLAFEDSLRTVGDVLSDSGEILSKFAHVRLTTGEEKYSILPELKFIDGDAEVTCNLDGFDQWLDILAGVSGLDHEETRRLYLTTAASWVELSFLALAAKQERDTVDIPVQRSRAIRRAASIVRKLADRETLRESAEELEVKHGIFGAVDAIEAGLSDEEVLRMNRLRYGMGTAYLALGYDAVKVNSVTESITETLKTELSNYEDSMLLFLTAFAEVDPYADIASNFQKLKRDSFPGLLFAITIPMGYEQSDFKSGI